MTSYNNVKFTLHKLKPVLKEKYGVKKIGFFDCFLDKHHNGLCELNVLVELEQPLGWRFFELKEWLEFKLGFSIDICTPASLKPALKDEILSQTHYV